MVAQAALLWMGTMALLITYVALSRSDNPQTQIVALGFSLLFWTGFTINASGYTVTTNAGIILEKSSQSLSILGFLGVGIVFVVLVKSVFDMVKGVSSG